MAVLSTVSDYVTQARALLQDEVSPYRYTDDALVTALNFGFYEVCRVRPDIQLNATYTAAMPPSGTVAALAPTVYTSSDMSPVVPVPVQYRMAFLYFIVGFAQLRDTEDVQDARASQFMNKFLSQLETAQA